jgi:hypothetical protein
MTFVKTVKGPVPAIKVYIYLHPFLTSTLDEDEWLTSRPGRFTPGKEPRYPLNTKAVINVLEKRRISCL